MAEGISEKKHKRINEKEKGKHRTSKHKYEDKHERRERKRKKERKEFRKRHKRSRYNSWSNDETSDGVSDHTLLSPSNNGSHSNYAVIRLHRAAEQGNVKKVKQFIQDYSHLDVNIPGKDGWTCLHFAARWGHIALAEFVLSNHGDVNAQTTECHETPLHMSILFQHKLITKLLLEHGANVDLVAKDGLTPRLLIEMAHIEEEKVEERMREIDEMTFDDERDLKESEVDGKRGRRADEEREWNEKLFMQWDSDVDDSFNYEFGEEGRTSTRKTDEEWRQMIGRQMYRKSAALDPPTVKNQEEEKRRLENEKKRKNEKTQRMIKDELEREIKRREERKREMIKKAHTDYELAWTSFSQHISAISLDNFPNNLQLAYNDIPWPSQKEEDIKDILLCDIDHSDVEVMKSRLRQETLRWHPDKFAQLAGTLLVETDKEGIFDRVKTISQMINSIRTEEKGNSG